MTPEKDIIILDSVDHTAFSIKKEYFDKIVVTTGDQYTYPFIKRIRDYPREGDHFEWRIINRDDIHVIEFAVSSGRERYSKEEFLDLLKTNYPGDFQLFLWHPEMLRCEYHAL